MIDYFVNNPTISYDSEEGLNFDINSSINNPILLEKWPNFLDDLKANPEQTLKFVKTAFFEVSLNRIMKEAPELFEKTFKMLRLNRINILNFGSINPISCVTWNSHGTYIRGSSTVSLDSKMKTGKESLKENWRFEAGALALSNSALLCLDEFDAMTSQHKIIYKTMKSQRVETMNAELKFSRPFRTSIFAMTDWIKKQYDPSKTILKNVNTNKQLLDQFDLILLMRDNPDAYLGNLMRTRILNEHKKRNPLDQRAGIFNRRDSEPRARTDLTLGERLANSSAHDSSTLLGEHFLGMYINYARIHVKPILSEASKRIITRFCLLRHRIGKDCIKLLINLTEARAKIDLRIETSELDAFDAIEILESSVCIDAKNLAQNHPKSINNTNKITTNKMKLFINDLKAEAFHEKKNIFSEQELRNIAGQENMTGLAFEELLGKLNEQGYLLKVSSKSYKIVFL